MFKWIAIAILVLNFTRELKNRRLYLMANVFFLLAASVFSIRHLNLELGLMMPLTERNILFAIIALNVFLMVSNDIITNQLRNYNSTLCNSIIGFTCLLIFVSLFLVFKEKIISIFPNSYFLLIILNMVFILILSLGYFFIDFQNDKRTESKDYNILNFLFSAVYMGLLVLEQKPFQVGITERIIQGAGLFLLLHVFIGYGIRIRRIGGIIQRFGLYVLLYLLVFLLLLALEEMSLGKMFYYSIPVLLSLSILYIYRIRFEYANQVE